VQKFIPAKEYPDFITVTCLNWKPLLEDDIAKKIVTDSLTFLARRDRVRVYAFVIMSNHFHLVWQMLKDHKREDVQRDFLKFTGQQILGHLRRTKNLALAGLLVNAKDRKYQVWERNSLSIPLWSENVLWQKIHYIHNNPVRAGLCATPKEYLYSSAAFYELNEESWPFLESV
jgi:putative transposase